MSKRKKGQSSSPKDWHLWSEVTRTVSPLKSNRERESADEANIVSSAHALSSAHAPAQPTYQPVGAGKLFRGQANTSQKTWSPPSDQMAPVPQNIHRHHPNSGIEPKMRRRVRRGRVPIDASIDLHGLRQDEARSALHRFMNRAIERGHRTILVITGKGLKKTNPETIFERGVLRHMLPVWLNEPALAPYIAGFEISAPHHGGEGAYYVRLKKA